MTIKIQKQNWTPFLQDFGNRRFEWQTRIEIIGENIGDQTLGRGMPLMGITAVESRSGFVVEILLGGSSHLSHTIRNPVQVAYLARQGKAGGIIEFEEFDGTKTLVHIDEPVIMAQGIAEGANPAALAVV